MDRIDRPRIAQVRSEHPGCPVLPSHQPARLGLVDTGAPLLDQVGTIVPYDWVEEPERLGEHTLELVRRELLLQVFPQWVEPRYGRRFNRWLEALEPSELARRREKFETGLRFRIHRDKWLAMGSVLDVAKHFGLVERRVRGFDGWIEVEETTANEFVASLALGLCHPDSDLCHREGGHCLRTALQPPDAVPHVPCTRRGTWVLPVRLRTALPSRAAAEPGCRRARTTGERRPPAGLRSSFATLLIYEGPAAAVRRRAARPQSGDPCCGITRACGVTSTPLSGHRRGANRARARPIPPGERGR